MNAMMNMMMNVMNAIVNVMKNAIINTKIAILLPNGLEGVPYGNRGKHCH